jgi:MFS family permease
VWAVAFACVISFMGIGLVDPILPALAGQLDAGPTQVELLFTSYLVVTAVAMLVTGWVSSRIGAKRTLIAGLVLIVVFAAAAGATGGIGGIVGFRAGWGLGNALFIATSLAVSVGSASGGFSGAIVLYETALGIGIASGPLLGGLLGDISWRGPFFGVSVLMLVALVATVVLVPPTPKAATPSRLREPITALRHRSLALFAVFGATLPKNRFGTARSLNGALGLIALILALIGIFPDDRWLVIVPVVVSGAAVGLNNTLGTTAVMSISPVPRDVASATYGFVRFIDGGLAPFAAGLLAEHLNLHVPFLLGAVAVLAGIVVLRAVRDALDAADASGGGPNAEEAGPVADALRTEARAAGRGRP